MREPRDHHVEPVLRAPRLAERLARALALRVGRAHRIAVEPAMIFLIYAVVRPPRLPVDAPRREEQEPRRAVSFFPSVSYGFKTIISYTIE